MGYVQTAARQAISTGTMLMMLPLLAGVVGPSIDQAVSNIQSSIETPFIPSFNVGSGSGGHVYINNGPIFLP